MSVAVLIRPDATVDAPAGLHGYREVARLGDVVELDRKPVGVGGRGHRMLRWRLVKLDTAGAWVYGPLVQDGDDWSPMPGRVVREYRVDPDTIIGGAA